MKKFCFLFLCLSFVFFSAQADNKAPLKLSLHEAIWLAIRTNPNVQSSQLAYVLQKFSLQVQQWEFYPHYNFESSASFLQKTVPGQPKMGTASYIVKPSVSLLTPIGTQITFASLNQKTEEFNPSLSLEVMQPLLRGFGRAIVEAALNNAKDGEIISRLNVEGTLRLTITAIINAYLDVMSAERRVMIDEEALKRAKLTIKQTKLFIKAGHKAGNELITVKANAASAQTQLENDKNALQESRYGLLAAIGIDPNTDVHFTTLALQQLIPKYHLPPLSVTKNAVLENDIQFQVDNITLHGATKRAVLLAEDATRWKLNLTASVVTGNGQDGSQKNGLNNAFNLRNQAQAVGLTLNVPIDDQMAKQALMSAKIALQQAELAFKQEKWSKETSAINGWHLVSSAERAWRYAAAAEKLQKKTYQVNYQKYLHGLIDSLELQTAEVQLMQTQQILLNAEINYIKALVNLDFLMGSTLHTWQVKVRL